MTGYLPPGLKELFAPRPPLPFAKPTDRATKFRKPVPVTGVAAYVKLFEDPAIAAAMPKPESVEQRRLRKKEERKRKREEEIQAKLAEYHPDKDPNATSDPFKTLFVGRLSYDVTERRLLREFEAHGPVTKLRLVKDPQTGKPCGYAFVEFEREKDMKEAYKTMDGLKIEGRRILVDVERSRTVKGWKPRRLGGGVGEGRKVSKPAAGAARGTSPPREPLGAMNRPRDDARFSGNRGGGGYGGGGDRGGGGGYSGGGGYGGGGGDRDGGRGGYGGGGDRRF